MTDKTTTYPIFEAYYRELQQRAQAVLPDERLAILAQMEQELLEEGIIPIGPGEVAQFNTTHPTYAAILRGDSVSIGGEAVNNGRRQGVAGLPLVARLGILTAVFLLPVLFFIGLIVFRNQGDEETTPTAVAPDVGMVEVPTAVPETPLPPTSLPTPLILTMTPTLPTPTPLPITALRGTVAEGGSDPASVEIAGEAFILSVGEPHNGIWLPQGAEWLAGSVVRRVIAIPYQADLMPRLETAVGLIKLRLRSGEIVEYQVVQAGWYRRDQIEVMADAMPSLILIVYGETGDERLVITGTAVQTKEVVLPNE